MVNIVSDSHRRSPSPRTIASQDKDTGTHSAQAFFFRTCHDYKKIAASLHRPSFVEPNAFIIRGSSCSKLILESKFQHFTTGCPNQRPPTSTPCSLQLSSDDGDSFVTRSSPST